MSAEALEVPNVQKERKEDEKETTPMVKLKKDKVRKKKEPKIRQEIVGDEVKFLCDKCGYKGPSKKSVKMHMGKKHRGEKRTRGAEDIDENYSNKRAKPEDDEADATMESIYSDEDDDSDDEDFLNKFDEDGNLIVEESKDKIDEGINENENKDVKFLEDEIVVKNKKIETLEDALKVKDELLHIANAKVATLEDENIEKENKAEKYKKIAKQNMKTEPDESKRLKKEAVAKTKEIADLKEKLAEALKKTRDEITMRAKAEADMISKQQTIDVMSEIMVRQSGKNINNEQQDQVVKENKSKQLCRDVMKPEGCRWGKRCLYFHPPGSIPSATQSGDKPDCSFWLAGYCKYSENECRGKHEPSKCGAKPRKSYQQKPAETNNQDFVQTLARAVNQGLAGAQTQLPSAGQQMFGLPQQMFPQQMMMMPTNPAAMFFPHLQGGQGGASWQ